MYKEPKTVYACYEPWAMMLCLICHRTAPASVADGERMEVDNTSFFVLIFIWAFLKAFRLTDGTGRWSFGLRLRHVRRHLQSQVVVSFC